MFSPPPPPPVSINPTLDFKYNAAGAQGVERFIVRAKPTIKIEGGVNVVAAFEGKVECKADLFVFRVPVGGPLALIIGGLVPVGVGIEAGGKITLATMGIGSKVELIADAKAGFSCVGGGFDCNLETGLDIAPPKFTPTLNAPSIGDVRLEPKFSAFGFVDASVGNPFFKSLRFNFIKIKASADLLGSFALKQSQLADPLYKSDYKLQLKAGVTAGSNLSEALRLFGLFSINAVELAITTDIAKSPGALVTGAVVADKDTFVTGDTVNFTVKLDPATVDFLPVIGPYNVKKIQLVRDQTGSPTVVGSLDAAPGQTVFNIAFTAPNAGTASQFSAFVVTTLLPLDLLALEVGGASVAAPAAPPVLIETVGGDFPQLAMDANGNAIAVWVQYEDGIARASLRTSRYVAGIGWGAVQRIDTDTLGEVDIPQIAMDASGNAVAVWRQSRTYPSYYNLWTARYTPATGWGPAELLETIDDSRFSHTWVRVAMNGNGQGIVGWVRYDGQAQTDVAYTIWAKPFDLAGGWGATSQLEGGSGSATSGLSVAINSSGTGFAMWTRFVSPGGDANHIRSSRFVPGAGWEASMQLGLGSSSGRYRQLAVDAAGNAVAVWEEINFGTAQYRIKSSRYLVNMGWSSPVSIATPDTISLNPQIVLDASGRATAAWAVLGNGYTLWSSEFIPGGGSGTGWGTPVPFNSGQVGTSAPDLTIDASNKVIAIWYVQGGDVWSSTFRPAQGWSAPVRLQEGLAVESRAPANRLQRQWRIDGDMDRQARNQWSRHLGRDIQIALTWYSAYLISAGRMSWPEDGPQKSARK